MRQLLTTTLLVLGLVGCTQGWGKIVEPIWQFNDFAWTEDGKELFFIFENQNKTQLYRWTKEKGHRPIPHFDAFPRIYNVDTFDGKLLASGEEIYFVDAAENAPGPAQIVDAPCCYVGARFVGSGRLLAWVSNQDDKSQAFQGLLTMDTNGKSVSTIAEGTGLIGLSGDRQLALYQDRTGGDKSARRLDDYDLIIRDLENSKEERIPFAELGEPYYVRGIIDRKHLLVWRQDDQGNPIGLFLRNLDSKGEQSLLLGHSLSWVKPMADGKRLGLLLSNRDPGNPWSLASMNLDGTDFQVHVNIRDFPLAKVP